MGKNKLAKWAEMESFDNVIQPAITGQSDINHPLRGKWNKKVFHNDNPLIIELGCGKGEYTIGLSEINPQANYVGVDIKGARMWRGAKTAHENRIANVAFLRTRIEFINSFFDEDEVSEIWLTFPDPHPGKKNSNKRLTCPWFLNKYRTFLMDNGLIHLKTDNKDLYTYTRSVAQRNDLEILAATNDLHAEYQEDNILLIRTHYENIFVNEGMKINYLSFSLPKNRFIE